MPRHPRRIDDPRALRALAHPLRIALLEHLALDGPLTATELASRVDESPSNCSWHLRKLAEHGLVEEAVDSSGGTGRRRPWRACDRGLSFGDDDDPIAQRAGAELAGQLLRRWTERHLATHDDPSLDSTWRQCVDVNQSMTWLTPAEVAELNEAVKSLLLRHVERLEDASARPPGSRLVEMVAFTTPLGQETDR